MIIQILNTRGRMMKSMIMSEKTNNVNIDGLVAGIYFVRCTLETNDVIIHKVIVY